MGRTDAAILHPPEQAEERWADVHCARHGRSALDAHVHPRLRACAGAQCRRRQHRRGGRRRRTKFIVVEGPENGDGGWGYAGCLGARRRTP
eukprot:scaffold1756_cov117-Isochrysis_galbana.AAC.18